MKLDELYCDESVPPAAGSCADSCCQIHDKCCGGDDRPVCNRAIVACLNNCIADNPDDKTCKLGVIPVKPQTIRDAMALVESWCCGSPCPSGVYMSELSELIVNASNPARRRP